MELAIVKQDSPEWNYMWDWLANHPMNINLEEPMVGLHEGEAWQYMGTFRHGREKGGAVHTFRHRNHPNTGEVENLNLHARPDFNEDDFDRSSKIV